MHGKGFPGFEPPPETPRAWAAKWTQEMSMRVPAKRGGEVDVVLRDIAPVAPGRVPGDPDLLVTTAAGKQFYVLFARGREFRSLDRPTLVFPVDRGERGAFWVMPVA